MTQPRALAACAALFLGVVSLTAGAVPSAAPDAASTLRVVSYNIHHGEGMDGVFDLARTARIIMEESPDLVALQEVDRATLRASGVDQAEELAKLTGMHVAFGRAMSYQGGEYGVAILSRWPILRSSNTALPLNAGWEPRTALTVDVDPDGDIPRVTLTNTHLDQDRDQTNRLLQAAALNQHFATEDGTPTILAGDMNSRVDTEVMEKLRSLWTDMFVEPPPADPNERPRYRVDYIMARPAKLWRPVESRAIVAPLASDHRAILAVMQWTD